MASTVFNASGSNYPFLNLGAGASYVEVKNMTIQNFVNASFGGGITNDQFCDLRQPSLSTMSHLTVMAPTEVIPRVERWPFILTI
ncbi:MAG: hypothetical protein R2827_06310 [Bdellovibrionales bacterium]